MNNFMTKEEMEDEFIVALGVIESMFEGIFNENIDNEINELRNLKVNADIDSKGLRAVVFRQSLYIMFNRSTKLALIFLNNAFNYCLYKSSKEKLDEIQELYNKYFKLSTEFALKIYNIAWDKMVETTKYKEIDMEIYNMIEVEKAYNNEEELKELLMNMPKVSEEEYRDFLYGKANKSSKIYEYLTRMS